MRYCGARGQLTVRADSGFYTHAVFWVLVRLTIVLLLVLDKSPVSSNLAI